MTPGEVLDRRTAFGLKLGLTPADARLLARLRTPEKIQDYIDAMPTNHELKGDTCLAVAGTLRLGTSHCIEGALLAAAALWMQGQKPLLMDFQAKGDDDHVIALFRRGKYWGAISKSNHPVLRWRDPVYRSLRELAMSYFHEYVNHGKKTMRTYSKPFDLCRYDPSVWVSGRGSCWDIASDLDNSRHYPVVTQQQVRALRKYGRFEQEVGDIVEYPYPSKAKGKS
jgi:hypothetical protein